MKPVLDPGSELFAFFEMTPDLVCIAGRDGYWKKVNSAVVNKLGYTLQELYASPISSFIDHEDKDLTQRRRNELLEGKVLHNFINRYRTKSGEILWLEWTSIYFSDNQFVFAIAKDVTERKKIEKEVEENYLKYKGLASYFKTSMEKDRKYLAYELHEALAQLVAALKMDIDWIASNEADVPASFSSRIEHAMEVSKLLVKTLQRISFSISPSMLDDLGLDLTLDWLCKEFSLLNKIQCSYENSYDENLISAEMKIDFFRIFQEVLTNIIDVSKAGKISLSIRHSATNYELCIDDDRNGIELSSEKSRAGLVSIQERVAFINGTVVFEPGLDHTRVCITIPQ